MFMLAGIECLQSLTYRMPLFEKPASVKGVNADDFDSCNARRLYARKKRVARQLCHPCLKLSKGCPVLADFKQFFLGTLAVSVGRTDF